REVLGLVHELAPAVVALSGEALGVLVRERAAHRLQHGRRDEVLGGDELEPVVLPLDLAADRSKNLGVLLLEGVHGGAGGERGREATGAAPRRFSAPLRLQRRREAVAGGGEVAGDLAEVLEPRRV